jgi:hypothetical protein
VTGSRAGCYKLVTALPGRFFDGLSAGADAGAVGRAGDAGADRGRGAGGGRGSRTRRRLTHRAALSKVAVARPLIRSAVVHGDYPGVSSVSVSRRGRWQPGFAVGELGTLARIEDAEQAVGADRGRGGDSPTARLFQKLPSPVPSSGLRLSTARIEGAEQAGVAG